MYIIVHNGARIFGGCERWIARTLPRLQLRGHRVKVLCNHDVVARELQARGLETGFARLSGDLVLSDAVRFAWQLRRERPDIVLFTTFKKIWLGGMATSLARVPRTVLRIGLSTDVPRRLKYRVALHAIDDVIVAAPELGRRFGERVSVVPNGVALPAVTQDRETFRSRNGIPADAFVVASAARLAQQKRLERLVDMLALQPEVHVAIAGEGSQRGLLERRAATRGVRERLHLLGHREDVGNLLNAADCYVISSDLEGMSSSMLEAMAVGLPVVSTPVSGAKFALGRRDGKGAAGIVLDRFDARAIADAVARVRQDAGLCAQLSEAARARQRADFQLEQMIDRYEAVLFGRQP